MGRHFCSIHIPATLLLGKFRFPLSSFVQFAADAQMEHSLRTAVQSAILQFAAREDKVSFRNLAPVAMLPHRADNGRSWSLQTCWTCGRNKNLMLHCCTAALLQGCSETSVTDVSQQTNSCFAVRTVTVALGPSAF
jgi:hypothetical protein